MELTYPKKKPSSNSTLGTDMLVPRGIIMIPVGATIDPQVDDKTWVLVIGRPEASTSNDTKGVAVAGNCAVCLG